MILDSGICSVFRKVNAAQPGGKPVWRYALIHQGWYGVVSYATAPARPTDEREEVRTDAKIRIWQNREIANHDIVILRETATVESGDTVYSVTRAWHGPEEGTASLITDLSLEVTKP